MKTIFISHAVKDKELIDYFVDGLLIGVLHLKTSNIFYTSGDGTKITSGEDWRKEIRKGLLIADVILLFISPYYKESEMCMCEMGAAWATDKPVIPIIIPPINYKTVGVIQEPNQIEKILDGESLDRLKDLLHKQLDIPYEEVKTDRWSAKKTKFVILAKEYLDKNKYPDPLTRDKFDELKKERDELKISVVDSMRESKEDKELIEKLKSIKDKEEVKKVIRATTTLSEFDEFEKLCDLVNDILIHMPPIIRGIIYLDFNDKTIDIDISGHRNEIKNADAEDYINVDQDDGSIDVDWKTTEEMRRLFSALRNLQGFMEERRSKDFIEDYEKKYKAPFKIDNKSFWERAFRLPLWLN